MVQFMFLDINHLWLPHLFAVYIHGSIDDCQLTKAQLPNPTHDNSRTQFLWTSFLVPPEQLWKLGCHHFQLFKFSPNFEDGSCPRTCLLFGKARRAQFCIPDTEFDYNLVCSHPSSLPPGIPFSWHVYRCFSFSKIELNTLNSLFCKMTGHNSASQVS